MTILGVSAFYHDSAACLIQDGRIVAAAQEERFTRRRQDSAFPINAIAYCLVEAQTTRVDAVVYYESPLTKFSRILTTSLAVAPRGFAPFRHAMDSWLRRKLWLRRTILGSLRELGVSIDSSQIHFAEHHTSHAASAFYPSPFKHAAVLTIDGVGEWATTTIGCGDGARLDGLEEIRFPHSIGLLYSAFTAFAGFRVNSGEYKLMGLAPYGEPRYADLIRDKLVQRADDGSFRLDMKYFAYLNEREVTNQAFADLFGGPARKAEGPLTQREMDIAASIQVVTEELVIGLASHAKSITGAEHLCLAGGVALNCVANGRLLRENLFKDIWIQPSAGDAGGALGAALWYWHAVLGNTREVADGSDSMRGSYLGPAFTDSQIKDYLDSLGSSYSILQEAEWVDVVSSAIVEGSVVGLFQGRMEFGPRALGNRSLVGDPRSPKMQSLMNLKIKQRESFRPFAPSCTEETAGEYFDLDRPSPYMMLVAPIRESRRVAVKAGTFDWVERVNQVRSEVPAVTHIDYSARVQTVSKQSNPRFHSLLEGVGKRTGISMVINTSFNVRGEPIVCTPEEAFLCFMSTEMDYLAIGSFWLRRTDQPNCDKTERWARHFAAD